MKKSAKIAIGVGVGAVVLVGGGYVASYFVAGSQLPSQASVEGVPIGGLSPDEAVETLRTEFADLVAAPLTLSAGAVSVELPPAESCLSADFEATVREAGGGFSWNPAVIVNNLTGGEDVPLVRTVDDAALSGAVEAVADSFTVEGVDATLAFVDGAVARTDAPHSYANAGDKIARFTMTVSEKAR